MQFIQLTVLLLMIGRYLCLELNDKSYNKGQDESVTTSKRIKPHPFPIPSPLHVGTYMTVEPHKNQSLLLMKYGPQMNAKIKSIYMNLKNLLNFTHDQEVYNRDFYKHLNSFLQRNHSGLYFELLKLITNHQLYKRNDTNMMKTYYKFVDTNDNNDKLSILYDKLRKYLYNDTSGPKREKDIQLEMVFGFDKDDIRKGQVDISVKETKSKNLSELIEDLARENILTHILQPAETTEYYSTGGSTGGSTVTPYVVHMDLYNKYMKECVEHFNGIDHIHESNKDNATGKHVLRSFARIYKHLKDVKGGRDPSLSDIKAVVCKGLLEFLRDRTVDEFTEGSKNQTRKYRENDTENHPIFQFVTPKLLQKLDHVVILNTEDNIQKIWKRKPIQSSLYKAPILTAPFNRNRSEGNLTPLLDYILLKYAIDPDAESIHDETGRTNPRVEITSKAMHYLLGMENEMDKTILTKFLNMLQKNRTKRNIVRMRQVEIDGNVSERFEPSRNSTRPQKRHQFSSNVKQFIQAPKVASKLKSRTGYVNTFKLKRYRRPSAKQYQRNNGEDNSRSYDVTQFEHLTGHALVIPPELIRHEPLLNTQSSLPESNGNGSTNATNQTVLSEPGKSNESIEQTFKDKWLLYPEKHIAAQSKNSQKAAADNLNSYLKYLVDSVRKERTRHLEQYGDATTELPRTTSDHTHSHVVSKRADSQIQHSVTFEPTTVINVDSSRVEDKFSEVSNRRNSRKQSHRGIERTDLKVMKIAIGYEEDPFTAIWRQMNKMPEANPNPEDDGTQTTIGTSSEKRQPITNRPFNLQITTYKPTVPTHPQNDRKEEADNVSRIQENGLPDRRKILQTIQVRNGTGGRHFEKGTDGVEPERRKIEQQFTTLLVTNSPRIVSSTRRPYLLSNHSPFIFTNPYKAKSAGSSHEINNYVIRIRDFSKYLTDSVNDLFRALNISINGSSDAQTGNYHEYKSEIYKTINQLIILLMEILSDVKFSSRTKRDNAYVEIPVERQEVELVIDKKRYHNIEEFLDKIFGRVNFNLTLPNQQLNETYGIFKDHIYNTLSKAVKLSTKILKNKKKSRNKREQVRHNSKLLFENMNAVYARLSKELPRYFDIVQEKLHQNTTSNGNRTNHTISKRASFFDLNIIQKINLTKVFSDNGKRSAVTTTIAVPATFWPAPQKSDETNDIKKRVGGLLKKYKAALISRYRSKFMNIFSKQPNAGNMLQAIANISWNNTSDLIHLDKTFDKFIQSQEQLKYDTQPPAIVPAKLEYASTDQPLRDYSDWFYHFDKSLHHKTNENMTTFIHHFPVHPRLPDPISFWNTPTRFPKRQNLQDLHEKHVLRSEPQVEPQRKPKTFLFNYIPINISIQAGALPSRKPQNLYNTIVNLIVVELSRAVNKEKAQAIHLTKSDLYNIARRVTQAIFFKTSRAILEHNLKHHPTSKASPLPTPKSERLLTSSTSLPRNELSNKSQLDVFKEIIKALPMDVLRSEGKQAEGKPNRNYLVKMVKKTFNDKSDDGFDLFTETVVKHEKINDTNESVLNVNQIARILDLFININKHLSNSNNKNSYVNLTLQSSVSGSQDSKPEKANSSYEWIVQPLKSYVRENRQANYFDSLKSLERERCRYIVDSSSVNGSKHLVINIRNGTITKQLLKELKDYNIATLLLKSNSVYELVKSFMLIAEVNNIPYDLAEPVTLIETVLHKFGRLTSLAVFHDASPKNLLFKFYDLVDSRRDCVTKLIVSPSTQWDNDSYSILHINEEDEVLFDCILKQLLATKIPANPECVPQMQQNPFDLLRTVKMNKDLRKAFEKDILISSISELITDDMNSVVVHFDRFSEKTNMEKKTCLDCTSGKTETVGTVETKPAHLLPPRYDPSLYDIYKKNIEEFSREKRHGIPTRKHKRANGGSSPPTLFRNITSSYAIKTDQELNQTSQDNLSDANNRVIETNYFKKNSNVYEKKSKYLFFNSKTVNTMAPPFGTKWSNPSPVYETERRQFLLGNLSNRSNDSESGKEPGILHSEGHYKLTYLPGTRKEEETQQQINQIDTANSRPSLQPLPDSSYYQLQKLIVFEEPTVKNQSQQELPPLYQKSEEVPTDRNSTGVVQVEIRHESFSSGIPKPNLNIKHSRTKNPYYIKLNLTDFHPDRLAINFDDEDKSTNFETSSLLTTHIVPRPPNRPPYSPSLFTILPFMDVDQEYSAMHENDSEENIHLVSGKWNKTYPTRQRLLLDKPPFEPSDVLPNRKIDIPFLKDPEKVLTRPKELFPSVVEHTPYPEGSIYTSKYNIVDRPITELEYDEVETTEKIQPLEYTNSRTRYEPEQKLTIQYQYPEIAAPDNSDEDDAADSFQVKTFPEMHNRFAVYNGRTNGFFFFPTHHPVRPKRHSETNNISAKKKTDNHVLNRNQVLKIISYYIQKFGIPLLNVSVKFHPNINEHEYIDNEQIEKINDFISHLGFPIEVVIMNKKHRKNIREKTSSTTTEKEETPKRMERIGHYSLNKEGSLSIYLTDKDRTKSAKWINHNGPKLFMEQKPLTVQLENQPQKYHLLESLQIPSTRHRLPIPKRQTNVKIKKILVHLDAKTPKEYIWSLLPMKYPYELLKDNQRNPNRYKTRRRAYRKNLSKIIRNMKSTLQNHIGNLSMETYEIEPRRWRIHKSKMSGNGLKKEDPLQDPLQTEQVSHRIVKRPTLPSYYADMSSKTGFNVEKQRQIRTIVSGNSFPTTTARDAPQVVLVAHLDRAKEKGNDISVEAFDSNPGNEGFQKDRLILIDSGGLYDNKGIGDLDGKSVENSGTVDGNDFTFRSF